MTPYLIIGSGRLSRHLQHYFTLESIPFEQWDRSSRRPLEDMLARAGSVVVLITDDAIEPFLELHATRDGPLWIHCSGCVTTPLADSAHPLMVFGEELYDLETYRRIPFVCERGRRQFPELFKGLGNPHAAIDSGLKPLYHALGAMGGNFSTILWLKVFGEAAGRLGLDRELFYPYLERVTQNLMKSRNPLTGPLSRGDERTIARHLEALAGDPFEEVYRAVVQAYRSDPVLEES